MWYLCSKQMNTPFDKDRPSRADRPRADRPSHSLGTRDDRSAAPSPNPRRARPRTIAKRTDPPSHGVVSAPPSPSQKRARRHPAPTPTPLRRADLIPPSPKLKDVAIPDIEAPFTALTDALRRIKDTAEAIHEVLHTAADEIRSLKHFSLTQTAGLLAASTRQVQNWAADPYCTLKAVYADRRPRFTRENIRDFSKSRQFQVHRSRTHN